MKTDGNSTKDDIGIVIAEDEPLIQNLMESYLADIPGINILGTAADGKEAFELVKRLHPAVVFMDIEMPGLDGLSAASELRKVNPETSVVFVTGHPEYAAQAFNLDALDYIVKPFTRECFAKSIKKLQKYRGLHHADRLCRIAVKNDHDTFFINLNDIVFIEKQIKKTLIHTQAKIYITSESLNSLEQRLSRNFSRCHKSYIANVTKIEKITPIADRIYQVTFSNYSAGITVNKKRLEELYSVISHSIG